jgi:hypothetical protein
MKARIVSTYPFSGVQAHLCRVIPIAGDSLEDLLFEVNRKIKKK